ncbi:leader peptidase (prepilin peptidase) / N-methyltransferase [Rathayibacter oskolensis]|uniref:Leader peptidase (Prepilin peptidase) / N-methyltransferase n=1 Tax=Rathayibacter oskolensis TaxID=1891671 RepID=A0A1X7N9D1_9MICO|nr:prepilin peptidase [Rathayibacter oskolensis]SMH34149.1 leader peptidase (prepilin peptidase) / N-methyltransferase [Rathayibacter oskolensis]
MRQPLPDVVAVVLGGVAFVAVALLRGSGTAALVVGAVSVPLVLSDVRQRLLPNALTVPVVLAGAAEAITSGGGAVPAVLATAVVLGALHLVGGLGMGDVKLGIGLAFPLADAGPLEVLAAPALAFLLGGLWALPLVLSGDRARIPFGPFQLAAFWIVLSVP